MAMAFHGECTQSRPGINMTPMIDILLVLMIIFMVIRPPGAQGLDAGLPSDAPAEARRDPAPQIVVSVEPDGKVTLNHESIERRDLPEKLRSLLGDAGTDTLFVRGDKTLLFQDVAQVVDIARGAGARRVGLLTR